MSRTRRKTALSGAAGTTGRPQAEGRDQMIALAAYYRAERRGFAPGGELEDWLAAESEIDAQLARRADRALRGVT